MTSDLALKGSCSEKFASSVDSISGSRNLDWRTKCSPLITKLDALSGRHKEFTVTLGVRTQNFFNMKRAPPV